MTAKTLRIAADIGGAFTDIAAILDDGRLQIQVVLKPYSKFDGKPI